VLAAQYEGERALYYREWIPFASILEQVHKIRDALTLHGP
jgi:hypothetical protein